MGDIIYSEGDFSFRVDTAAAYIEFVSSGMWNDQTVVRWERELDATIATARRTGVSLRMLVDVRRRQTNSLSVAARIQGVIRRKSGEFERVAAVLSSSAILVVQARRLLSGILGTNNHIQLFGPNEIDRARAWLAERRVDGGRAQP